MMTCNDCGRNINYCDRYGCREVNGVAWECRGIADAKAAFDKHAKELDVAEMRELLIEYVLRCRSGQRTTEGGKMNECNCPRDPDGKRVGGSSNCPVHAQASGGGGGDLTKTMSADVQKYWTPQQLREAASEFMRVQLGLPVKGDAISTATYLERLGILTLFTEWLWDMK